MTIFYIVSAVLCAIVFARALIRWVGLADRYQLALQMNYGKEVARCRALINKEKWIMLASFVIFVYVACKLYG